MDPADLGPLALALLLLTSFAGSFLTAAAGIGGGVLLLAVMASIVPPAALIPVHGVVQLGSNAGRAVLLRSHIRREVVPAFLAGAAAGAALGGALAVELPTGILRISVGLFVLWSLYARPPARIGRSGALAGVVSGGLTMFVGATGPFVAAYLKLRALPRHAHVATHTALMTAQHAVKIGVFALLGFAFGPWIPLAAAMIAVGFLGTVAGRRVLDRLSERGFSLALTTVLTLLALRLLWLGVSDL
ncbi:MAG: sulfite exporter TauE/SafE family protein [Pseudomonadota bacterium]